jgi:hypothetical protein
MTALGQAINDATAGKASIDTGLDNAQQTVIKQAQQQGYKVNP